MGNTEILIETMAQKISVLKERLAAVEVSRSPGDHLTACKLDCLMSMLPLLLGGPRAASVGPAPDVSQYTSKIAKLEADKMDLKAKIEKLKAEKEVLEHKVTVEPEKVELGPVMEGIFGTPVETPVAPEAQDWEALNKELQDGIDANTEKLAVCQQALEEARQQQAQVAPEREKELLTKLAAKQAELDKCYVAVSAAGLPGAPSEQVMDTDQPDQVTAIEEPVPAPPLPETAPLQMNQRVLDTDPRLKTTECAAGSEVLRSIQVGHRTADRRGKPKDVYKESISKVLDTASKLTWPAMGITGLRGARTAEWNPKSIQLELQKRINRLEDAYMRIRPGYTDCAALKAQFLDDVRNLISTVACQYVVEITRRAARFPGQISDAITESVPDDLKAPCNESLTSVLKASQGAEAMKQKIASDMQEWMNAVLAKPLPEHGDAVVMGLFCATFTEGRCTNADGTTQIKWVEAWQGKVPE